MPKSPDLSGLFAFSMVIEISRGSIFIDIIDIGILACSNIGEI
jgi:hypothetical protein